MQAVDAGQSLFQCVIGTESEFGVKRLREALGQYVKRSWALTAAIKGKARKERKGSEENEEGEFEETQW